MQQQINLYQLKKEKKKFDIKFEEILHVFGVYLIGLALITAFDTYGYFKIRKEEEALTRLHEEQSKRLEAVSSKVPKEHTRKQIVAQIEKYDGQIKDKKKILSMLSQAKSTQIEGYSSYMEALASMSVRGLWLTEFVFKNNGGYLLLEGRTMDPELIPTLISNLSGSNDFSGKKFEVFKMSLDEETKQVDFILETKTLGGAS